MRDDFYAASVFRGEIEFSQKPESETGSSAKRPEILLSFAVGIAAASLSACLAARMPQVQQPEVEFYDASELSWEVPETILEGPLARVISEKSARFDVFFTGVAETEEEKQIDLDHGF